jgi:hypothetical protein
MEQYKQVDPGQAAVLPAIKERLFLDIAASCAEYLEDYASDAFFDWKRELRAAAVSLAQATDGNFTTPAGDITD